MKLSLKQKALLMTIGILSSIVIGSLVVTFIIANVSAQTIINAFILGSLSLLIWAIYGIVLSRLEYQEKLKELNESIKG